MINFRNSIYMLVSLFAVGSVLFGVIPQTFAQSETNCGIFVAPSGLDGPTAGLLPSDPCQTINFGIARARDEGLTCVFVQVGQYMEIVNMASGVDVQGGFDIGWAAGPHDQPGFEVRILGGLDPETQQYMAVKVTGIDEPTYLHDVIVDAPDAVGLVNRNGRSSYGIYVVDSTGFEIWDSRIEGGGGADGAHGADGSSASSEPAPAGGNGEDGARYSTACNSSYSSGGAGAVNGDVEYTGGGAGGKGGSMDTECTLGLCSGSRCDARAGTNGGDPASGIGSGGWGAYPCMDGVGGSKNGNGADGSGGPGGSDAGYFSGEFWFGSHGSDGQLGQHGSGGGGGGGGGGCDTGTDARGGAGGGGGAGGLRAPVAGQGGGGGGGSIGILALRSVLTCGSVDIVRGEGGNGGNGGFGGTGQPGGLGGLGGSRSSSDIPFGGNGGYGGRGGHSGCGGGGGGGASVGIIPRESDIHFLGSSITGGTPGNGGPGGHAVGTPGQDGMTGNLVEVYFFDKSRLLAKSEVVNRSTCDLEPCRMLLAGSGGAGLSRLALLENVPNPFNPLTEIFFEMPNSGEVDIRVFDLTGRVVRRLTSNEVYQAGRHSVPWNGRCDRGRRVASGSYLVRMQVGGEVHQRKIMLMK